MTRARRMAAACALAVASGAGGCGERAASPPVDPSAVLAARGAGETFLQQDRIDEARAVESAPAETIDPSVRENLEALGYVE